MEISHVEMERINDQRSTPSVGGFTPHNQSGSAHNEKQGAQDTFVLDGARQYLRDLCSRGEAVDHIQEIIESGIEPDFLRAELAFRFSQGEVASLPIIVSYLAGNFRDAYEKTLQLEKVYLQKFQELLIFSDYFTGRYEQGCEAAKDFASLNFSPFLCYAYSDMLLSLGYVDEAREYRKKYIALARVYLKNFESDREKYARQQKGREKWRGYKDSKDGDDAEKRQQGNGKNPSHHDMGEQTPALYGKLREMIERRRVLLDILKTQNVNIDKRPLLFELEDIEAIIAQTNGRFERQSLAGI